MLLHKGFIDIQRFQTKHADCFEKGDIISVQEKLDGSCSSIQHDNEENKLMCFSRRKTLSPTETLMGFYEYVQKLDMDIFKKYSTYRLFGEWNLSHLVKYAQEEIKKFHCFDIYDTMNKVWLPQDIVKAICKEGNIQMVPIFYEGEFISWDHIQEFIGKTQFGLNKGEGCFHGKTQILMSDETSKPISQVKVGDMVKSYNEKTGLIEDKKVLNVFNNGEKPITEWGRYGVSVYRHKHCDVPESNMLIVTHNHKIWNGNGYTPISQSNTFYQYDYVITKEIKQAILGLLLSDGSIDNRSNLVIITQKKENRGDDLYRLFSPISNKPYYHISGKGTEMITFTINKRHTRDWINKYINSNGRKNCKAIIEDLDEIGMAFFYMGDGTSYKKGRAEISTHSFSLEEIDAMKNKINDLYNEYPTEKIDKRVNLQKYSGISLLFNAQLRERFESISGKYFLPSFRYKIRNEHEWISLSIEKGLVKKPILSHHNDITENNTNYKKWRNIEAFDIEVEDNHNYFAEKVLVHNCVIKNQTKLNNPDERKPFVVKLVSTEYQETAKNRHIREPLSADEIAKREYLSDLTASIVTENRVEKNLYKMITENVLPEDWDETSMSLIAKELPRIIYNDCVKEENDTVEKIENFGKLCASHTMQIVRKMLQNR